jgi:putative phosphoesterase
MLIAIISDTHLPRGARALPAACVSRLQTADLILHAGDFSALTVLDQLHTIGPPVHAVHGNVDELAVRQRLPAAIELDLGGSVVAMTHDAGPAQGRLMRLSARFPKADAVIFGHSHIPLHETGPDGFQIFNPGSPTERRRSPHHTMGLARIENGSISFELVVV